MNAHLAIRLGMEAGLARRRLNEDSALRSFEHLLQLARLRRTHRVVIAADVVSADEDIWHGALPGLLL